LTSPVVAAPRAEVRELDALPPLPAAPSGPSPAPADAESPRVAPTSGFWIQLGAFSQRDGVERLQQQVARSLPAVAGALNVFAERGTYRLQAGPYASRDQARDMAEQVRNGLQLAPMIVERR
jgi:rare lipoprotein A